MSTQKYHLSLNIISFFFNFQFSYFPTFHILVFDKESKCATFNFLKKTISSIRINGQFEIMKLQFNLMEPNFAVHKGIKNLTSYVQ